MEQFETGATILGRISSLSSNQQAVELEKWRDVFFQAACTRTDEQFLELREALRVCREDKAYLLSQLKDDSNGTVPEH